MRLSLLQIPPPLATLSSSDSYLLLDPLSQFGDAGIDTWLVATSTALAPAHNACLEPLPTFLETCQGSAGVSLPSTTRPQWLLDWCWKRESDNYGVKKKHLHCSPGMHRLLRTGSHCRAFLRWPGPLSLCYTRSHWWFSLKPSVATGTLELWGQTYKGVIGCPILPTVHHWHQKVLMVRISVS